jgi:uncharacterized protein YndB with AHSA1/START domain
MGRTGSATVHVDASADAVYDLVTDLSRMGEWSPETVKAEWLDGAAGPAEGVRFKGSNKHGILRWSTKPVVEVAERGREFTFATMMGGKKYTRWSYRFAPAASGGGTDVTESWEEINGFPVIGGLMLNDKRAEQLTEGCRQTLERIKAAAEAS